MTVGIDQGYCINYWRLSYRRRFIRDLWITPVAFVLIALLFWWLDAGFPSARWYWMAAAIVIIGVVSAVYNYQKWQAQAADSETL
jgi:hypothetical protein